MERINVVLRDVITETPDTYSLVLENHPELKTYEAGQFVNVHCIIDNEEIQRSYSFSTSPLADPYPVLTIKKVPGGKISNGLHEMLKPGDTLTVSYPLGRFVLDKKYSKTHMLLIAGGSGITPIFGMLKEGLKRSPEMRFILVYANRNDKIIFHSPLEELAREYKNRLDIHYFLDEGNLLQTTGKVYQGKISKGFFAQLFHDSEIPVNDVTAYVCGPQSMMLQCISWLQELRVLQDQIRTEYFAQTKFIDQNKPLAETITSKVMLLNHKGTQKSLSVSRNRDILSEFLAKGYDLPHSCREAMCGSCAVRLVKGQVDMKENYALNDTKLSEGYVLLCQSVPVSSEVILEYDS